MDPTLLQQSILVIFSFALAIVVRRRASAAQLSFGTAAMWVGLAGLSLVAAFAIPYVGRVGSVLGLLPAAILAGAASLLLGSIAFSLSTRVSRLEADRQDLAEALGRFTIQPPLDRSSGSEEFLALVPAFNETNSIGDVVSGLRSAGLPVLVIDDGSTDATGATARSAGASVLRLPINLGVGGALRAGLRTAADHGFQQVVQCDADGQHPLESIIGLIEAQRKDPADLLIGSRFLETGARKKQGLTRYVATLLLAWVASRTTGRRITDATSGMRVIRAPLLEEFARSMPPHYLGDTFEANVMAGRAGYLIREIPSNILERRHGSSSATPWAAFRLTLRGLLVAVLRIQGPVTRR